MEETERIIFLRGKKVILRPLRKETDLERCLKWINDQEVLQYLYRYLPTSFPKEEEWFNDLLKRENDIVLGIETEGDDFIGTIGLHNIDWKDRRAILGIMIGEKTYWEKGLGTDVVMILLDYAFNKLNLLKVNSSVVGYNKRSFNLHLKCGFKQIGRHKKQFFKNCIYADEILLEVFKKDWQKAKIRLEGDKK